MGGVVQLDSHLGVGSTFWIELPLIENHVSFPKSIEVSGHSSNSSDSFEGNLGTILYIEDNVSNIELVENILSNQREGIRLLYTTNGHEALEFAIEHKPDLILLDLDLPGIHGTEVFAKLQANAKTKSIPVVIISADAMPKQIETLMMAGAKDYLTKPFDILMFLQMVDEWVKH
jgi:CheY-like chemotaxis protein